ncbi:MULTISPECIES: winged helix-turn-helix transcriptional regulator [Niastella]|uniref:Helix-turn-helix transcriptional regulator n=1 Tax=Niastella soli TaxID=2821487 RepID=A0ABS3YP35_9BACT|nr:helix-turn-helix domain-containing protein [Niastella soli]MBO9199625.1 helix-turn-helix transcriptional regulator [Niastella soli]
MTKIKQDTLAKCPVDYAFQRIGGKYKARVLWFLREEVKRYGELRRFVTGITPKMLTQVLRELEEDQLIIRTVYFEVPPRVEYSLTDSARELMPAIIMISTWGQEQMQQQGMPVMQETQGEKM